MTAVLVQTGASLVAVLFIAWLVGKMGLGADPRIADEAHAIRLAEEAEAGFCGIEVARDRAGFARSEEHTSELQSLMRISYAVFCLKKKNNKQQLTTRT